MSQFVVNNVHITQNYSQSYFYPIFSSIFSTIFSSESNSVFPWSNLRKKIDLKNFWVIFNNDVLQAIRFYRHICFKGLVRLLSSFSGQKESLASTRSRLKKNCFAFNVTILFNCDSFRFDFCIKLLQCLLRTVFKFCN